MEKKKKRYNAILLVVLIFSILVLHIDTAVVGAKTYKPGFTYRKLTPAVKEQIRGKSFPVSGSKISFSSLRLVTVKYYDFKGKTRTGKLIVNKKIARRTVKIFSELYKIRYRIQRIKLVDCYHADDNKSMEANNTSAFNYRVVEGTNKLSKHGMGMAIDINPRINPCIRGGKLEPANGRVYRTRNVKKCKGKYKKYMIHKNDKVYRIFKKYGFSWGGDWKTLKDYQHFEYTGK